MCPSPFALIVILDKVIVVDVIINYIVSWCPDSMTIIAVESFQEDPVW